MTIASGTKGVRDRLAVMAQAGIVIGISIAASGINFAAQVVLAYYFGAGLAVDVYGFALSVPTFTAGLIAAIVSYTVVPAIAGEETGDMQAAFGNAIMRIVMMVAAAILLAGVPALFLQPLLLPAGSPIGTHAALPTLVMAGWALAAVQIVAATWGARLNATGSAVGAAMMALGPGIGAIAFLIVGSDWSITLAVGGMIAGTLAAIACAAMMGGQRQTVRHDSQQMKARIGQLAYRSLAAVVALSCFSSYAVSDAFWGPRVGEGTLAALGYAQRIVIGFGALAVTGPSALCVPMFARLVAAGDLAGFRRLFAQTLGWVALIGGVLALLVTHYATDVVAVMFERGAFGATQVDLVAGTIRHMAAGMFFMLISVIAMRALFCLPDCGVPAALLGSGWTLTYFVLSGVFADGGARGIAIAYSISWGVFAVLVCGVVTSKSRVRSAAESLTPESDRKVTPC